MPTDEEDAHVGEELAPQIAVALVLLALRHARELRELLRAALAHGPRVRIVEPVARALYLHDFKDISGAGEAYVHLDWNGSGVVRGLLTGRELTDEEQRLRRGDARPRRARGREIGCLGAGPGIQTARAGQRSTDGSASSAPPCISASSGSGERVRLTSGGS